MNQIKCVICGELWCSPKDDMEAWEYELFKAGAGCPCCEGVEPKEPWHPSSLEDIENGDGDPIDRLAAYENRGKIKWERPPDELIWACDSCGVRVMRDANKEYFYDIPYKSNAWHWYSSHPFRDEEEDAGIASPCYVFNSGLKVCVFCHDQCEGCGTDIAPFAEFGDTYDEGNAFRREDDYYGKDYFCIDCFEQMCDICQEIPEDCKCGTCVVCGERKCDDDFETGDTCRDCYVEEVEEA